MTHHRNSRRTKLDPVELWEALLDDVAEQEAEDHEPTEDDRRWAQGVTANVTAKLSELRQRAAQAEGARPRALRALDTEIPPHIQALNRETLLAQLEVMRQKGEVRYAFQELTGLSDDGLRRLLALVVAPTKR